MKLQTNVLKAATDWVEKNWVRDQSYNLTMAKATKSTAPVWAQQLIKDVKELKEDVVDFKEFVVEQKKFNAKVETFIEEQKIFNAQVFEFMKEQREFNKEIIKRLDRIENCPTIKRELTFKS